MANRTVSDIGNDIQASLITASVVLVEAADKYQMDDEDKERIQSFIDDALKQAQLLKMPTSLLPRAAGGCSTTVRV